MPVLNPNPDQFQVMNFGAAASAGQDIQFNRLRNEAAGMDMQEAQDMLRNRAKANEIRSQFAKMPDQIQELEKAGLFDQADKLRDTYIQTKLSEVELIEGMRAGIDETNYKQVRQDMIASGSITSDLWPVEYSDKWFRDQAKDSRGALTKLTRKWAEGGAIFTQDLIQGDGTIQWAGDPYQDPDDQADGEGGKGSGKGWKFTATDSNAIGKQSERLFGGFYDPMSGRITGLDSAASQKVAAIQAEAEAIFQQGAGEITHGQALAQSARKFGVRIQDVRDRSTTDPLGLFPDRNP